MDTKYQLILIGNNNTFREKISEIFLLRIKDLGLPDKSVAVIDQNNFHSEYKANSPTVCIYFGEDSSFPNIDILDIIIRDAGFVLPAVNDIKIFSKLVPPQLRPINGFELKTVDDIEPIVSSVMEGLGLLRLTRRLFISYRRVESRSVAIQLYEYLDQHGFDVFLDTHSIRPGEPFQDELWHRLVDTDVVVLLNTPGFLESEWTEQELAKASAMSVGVLQLIWPQHKQEPYSTLCFPLILQEDNFEGKNFKASTAHLTDDALKDIGSRVESLRARSLAARQDNLIQEFLSSAKNIGIIANLQPEKFITIQRKDGKEVAIIPTVGVPHGFTYNQSEELIKRIRAHSSPKAFLIYDQRNIREKWQIHLSWLDQYLPVKTVKITEIDKWMQNYKV